MRADLYAKQNDVLGESPLWSEAEQSLYWIDIGRNVLHRRTAVGHHAEWVLPARPGCVAEFEDGRLAVTAGDGLYRFSPSVGRARLLVRIKMASDTRFNEGKVDSRGRLWFGSMQNNFGDHNQPRAVERSIGALHRLDRGNQISLIEEHIGICNAIAWSPDERRFYCADSLLGQIFVYNYDADTGAIQNKRVFFGDTNFGVPDGSAIDIDGCIWNARWGSGQVIRITPTGRVDRRVDIPAPQVTSCAFGGPSLGTLFVTSARFGMDLNELTSAPLSGSVFSIDGLAHGQPVPQLRDQA